MNEIILDIIGIIILASGLIFCAVIVHMIQRKIYRVLPCESAILEKRMEALNGNLHTAFINTIALTLFLILKGQWFFAKIDTAPVFIDIQVLVLETIIVLTLCRSSVCSLRNAERLLTVRDNDTATACQHCPKVKNASPAQ